MELVEMYNDLLLARFGLLESMKSLDPGLEECVSSIIWVAPRLESECQELKVVADELAHKFGKDYASECKSGRMKTISPRVMQRFSEQPPSKLLVEKYLFEIANSHKVQFKPDSEIALQDPEFFYNFSHSAPMPPPHQSNYHNDNNNNNAFGGNSGGGGGGGSAAPQMPIFPSPQISHIGFNTPVNNYQMKPVQKLKEPDEPPVEEEKLNLPDVPGSDSFDDLTKRFENLKKNK
jgi:vacuolar protein sorting-associated protein IST1